MNIHHYREIFPLMLVVLKVCDLSTANNLNIYILAPEKVIYSLSLASISYSFHISSSCFFLSFIPTFGSSFRPSLLLLHTKSFYKCSLEECMCAVKRIVWKLSNNLECRSEEGECVCLIPARLLGKEASDQTSPWAIKPPQHIVRLASNSSKTRGKGNYSV